MTNQFVFFNLNPAYVLCFTCFADADASPAQCFERLRSLGLSFVVS